MTEHNDSQELLEFPCDYEFKVFGPNHDEFRESLIRALESMTPVSRHALRERESSAGTYRCITVVLRVHSRKQLDDIYLCIRSVEGLRYLL